MRISALDSQSDFDSQLQGIDEFAESERGTDPDARPKVAFGVTMPAPIDVIGRGNAADGLLAELRGGSQEALYEVPKIGDLVADRYRVIRSLGEGGMGVVYEVSHARLDRSFALKLLRPDKGRERDKRAAFFREAKYASSLVHKNLISVLDYGEDAVFGAFMVMELAAGLPLSEFRRRRGKLSVKRACDIVLQIAQALAYIHSQNLIHCDLKPQNVMLVHSEASTRKSYNVKLLDFGLAQTRNSSPGSVFGTPRYISPEVAMSEAPTDLSDVYSLGILLFELLTGSPPFSGDARDLMRAHIRNVPPSLATMRGEPVDAALEQLVSTALAKYPDRRQRSMSAFIYELKNFMQMSGMVSKRASQAAAAASVVQTPAHDERSLMALACFDAVRLPLASIAREGTILAANAAFSKFVIGMRVGLEGSNIRETPLASAWTNIERDIEAACNGATIGRRVEIDMSSGETVRLQMWLEPTKSSTVVVLSLHPEQ